MDLITTQQVQTMSTREIAELLGKQHSHLKISAERLAFQAHIDAGRFSVKAGEASGHAFQQTRVEPAGIAWLASR
tara:strand:+ start:89 stop:313 length:225 start_codon:yes stop_codon:yes gene_type:complete